jgi:Mg-chelatase subunit ChlD
MLLVDYHWLILLIPSLWLIWHFRPLSSRILFLRVLLIILVVLALAGLHLRLPGREGIIVVVADRSLSMPAEADSRVKETMSLLKTQMPPGARLGLVACADEARVEMAPGRSSFSGFTGELNLEASRLDKGIQRALSLIPEELTGRVMVISDGLWSGSDPRIPAFQAASRNIPIDFRWLSRDLVSDMAITSFNVPDILSPGEAFIANALIFSPVAQVVQVGLFSSNHQIASFTRELKVGDNSLIISLKAPPASVVRFRLKVTTALPDPLAENNEALAISEVVGKKPVLVIADNSDSSMFKLLQSSGMQVELIDPLQINWSIEFLAGYSAVIIENVSAGKLTMHGMQLLAAWVNQLGGGLVLTGGKNSFGNGGYYQSPLETILPVSLELRSQHRKLALAMMVVLDRSGSMAAPSRGGRTKMDLANLAAASSLDLLSPLDEFGLLAVDTEAHVVVPLQRMTEKSRWREQILHVESAGGGIYVFEGISKAAEMLLKAEAQTRHIILFADASDAEQPGRYWELLEKATAAGLTLSVIGLGTDSDPDANLLRKIAAAGKGRVFFTRDPEELPRLFSQDTFVAARSTFIEEAAAIESLAPASRFVTGNISVKSQVGAYNLCYIRPEAFMAVRTIDENAAPILAAWQSGLGKVACYTGVAGGKDAGRFVTEPEAASLLSGVCNWVTFDDRHSFGEMTVAQQISKGMWRAEVFLDPDRERETFTDTPEIDLVRSIDGSPAEVSTMKMQWVSADSLGVETMLRGNEVIAGIIRSGKLHKRLNPVCQPYCPEFSLSQLRDGLAEMKDLAAISGGHEVIDLGRVWDSLPQKVQLRSFSTELLFLALLVFLVEVAERRTAALSVFLSWLKLLIKTRSAGKIAAGIIAEKGVSLPAAVVSSEKTAGKTFEKITGMQSTNTTDEQAKTVVPPEQQAGFTGALKSAKKQAGRRTRG